jgi:hypothetical protein
MAKSSLVGLWAIHRTDRSSGDLGRDGIEVTAG